VAWSDEYAPFPDFPPLSRNSESRIFGFPPRDARPLTHFSIPLLPRKFPFLPVWRLLTPLLAQRCYTPPPSSPFLKDLVPPFLVCRDAPLPPLTIPSRDDLPSVHEQQKIRFLEPSDEAPPFHLERKGRYYPLPFPQKPFDLPHDLRTLFAPIKSPPSSRPPGLEFSATLLTP